MRGAHRKIQLQSLGPGIIPAYAGSTHPRLPAIAQRGDHPRVCGEHSNSLCLFFMASGSSPRMRGAPALEALYCHLMRIIPAYAGSTTRETFRETLHEDHPRVCGEHPVRASSTSFATGSSPRMRGAQHGGRPERLPGRIIPAYAGSTFIAKDVSDILGDHPRVCGEHGPQ